MARAVDEAVMLEARHSEGGAVPDALIDKAWTPSYVSIAARPARCLYPAV